jgi:hypothetical protein
MRQTRGRFALTLGSILLLVITAAASIGLNTDLSAPPRFDGAGYAVLGEALASGRGYREINEPDAPQHDHFPPGYPAALAIIWRFTGRSVVAAHLLSVVCTVAAVLLAWKWFRTLYSPAVALVLALALAVNWTWGRIGGSIQSEPLFMLWELLAVLAARRAGRCNDLGAGISLGVTLAACILIRHVGVCFAAAALLDLGLRRRWTALLAGGLTSGVLVLPWVVWLAIVDRHTQIALFTHERLAFRIAGQLIFYFQRLPDQITGPFVEVGTLSHRPAVLILVANLWALALTGAMVWGWARALKSPRRRLAGMIAFTTLALLLFWPFTEAGRFLIPLVPFLLVGLTESIAKAASWRDIRRARLVAVTLVVAASVPYAAYSVVTGRAQAQRLTHADVDGACRWILRQPERPGPILTRHPGEVFWQTGRLAVEPGAADPDAIGGLIDRLGIAYLIIDENRYMNEASNPLQHYVERFPERVVLAWSGIHGNASVRVFETRPPK